MDFIDRAIIHVKAGNGGDGGLYFLREKYRPQGGPAGGDGGKGGDIIIEGSKDINTLYSFKFKHTFIAQNGEKGKPKNQHGKDGKDVIIKVPIGTLVIDEQTKEIICDITKDKQRCIVAKGGRGGKGNAHFATPTNQAPRKFEKGEKGEEKTLLLELKLIADIGIIGFPNVGKSTLLSVLTKANPKIGDYPFTTTSPNLGVLELDEENRLILADIPGIIENASKGEGLGLEFLRHIERTKALAIAIDISILNENPIKDFEILLKELKEYDKDNKKEILKKIKIIIGTKKDLSDKEREKLLENYFTQKGYIFLAVSSITKENIEKLKKELFRVFNT